ncbi:hypothetical protein IU474_21640 [Nocardia otitidiscaviarum]|uniref:hypothetical protein n=1 Tax=Nocardia otitidiscaviarum TaxID=1823 RepID=UPI0018936F3A|nr:hypothetical protein [Nocardia otitidiscaviarum]MBF6239655.1 hypothetical protein [Nocardia otitidiscaviarum]
MLIAAPAELVAWASVAAPRAVRRGTGRIGRRGVPVSPSWGHGDGRSLGDRYLSVVRLHQPL